jgi:hypothetical protein
MSATRHVLKSALCLNVALFAAAPAWPASPDVPEGRIYVLHSGPEGGCPHMDWHVVVEPDGDVAGMISWNDMKTIARLTGHVNRTARTFSIVAVEVGGQGARAVLDGRVAEDGTITADVKGPNVVCRAVAVPPYRAAGNTP